MSYKEVNKEEALALLRRPGSDGGMAYRESPKKASSSMAGPQQQPGSEGSHPAGSAKEEEHSGKSKVLLTSANVKHSLLPAIIYGEGLLLLMPTACRNQVCASYHTIHTKSSHHLHGLCNSFMQRCTTLAQHQSMWNTSPHPPAPR
jgi:hypothetical protein